MQMDQEFSHSQLYSKFEISLGEVRPFFFKEKMGGREYREITQQVMATARKT